MTPTPHTESLRVLFAGGGTGGHLMPGAAIASALSDAMPGARCLFLTTPRRSEQHCHSVLRPFETAEVPAARWGGLVRKLRFALTSLPAASRSLEVMRDFQPHAVVGLGGYSCVVPVLVARALALPTMILESNAVPGRVVRLLAPAVDCVQLQWREARRRLSGRRTVVTGNPVRPSLLEGNPIAARQRLGLAPERVTLLVMGGSQGALAINQGLEAALRHLCRNGETGPESLQILHLTGPRHLEEARRTPVGRDLIYRPLGFLDRMEDAYAAADVVLGRAGGSTLAETTALGLPSLLVPYPHATDGHQLANAQVLARAGAALVIRQNHLTPDLLADLLQEVAERPGWLRSMAQHARTLGRPRAAQSVAAELARMAGFGFPQPQTEGPDRILSPTHRASLSKAA